MPVADRNDSDVLSEKDRDLDSERDKEKGSKTKGSSKTKDLSHVPCKFFKVGSCTAGSSCPFSHASQEPGHQKDVCAWFVKGNCKFGHKCALAHILPGQSMAMDRKNKKAAQVAANAGGGGASREKGGRGQKKDSQSNSATAGVNGRNPLLSGSTAPTRATSSRPPIAMSLKATISPSAPAPPLKDTDFTSFGLPDEANNLPTAPAQTKPPQTDAPETAGKVEVPLDHKDSDAGHNEAPSKSSPSPLPLSTPRRLGMPQHRSTTSVDFGPIGSPPRSSPSAAQTSRINGFSPGTSPSHGNTGFVSTSPFSAPGTQTVFLSYDKGEPSNDFKARSGLAASLGATRTWKTDLGPVPSQVTSRVEVGSLGSKALGGEFAVEDEDLEEFLPSSLTDLLTPEERSRRMSRTNSGQPPLVQGMLSARDSSASGQRNNSESSHRYSRSVPAPSLLGDIRSIWSDAGAGLAGSPDAGTSPGLGGLGLGSGTPTSYKSNTGFGGRSFGEETHSPSLLSPSNASAAFLPGLHHHYLNSKAGVQRTNSRGTPSSLHPSPMPGPTSSNHFSANNYAPPSANDAALSPPRMNAFGSRPPFEAAPADPYFTPQGHQPSGRPIPGGNNGFGNEGEEHRNALSPSARALQAHAPGQSLPQGLAAGYSRIHALPPPPSIPSPSATGGLNPSPAAFSPGTNGNEWTNSMEHSPLAQTTGNANATGLESVFSRLSYSAATAARPPQSPSIQSPSVTTPPGLARNSSGRNWQSQGPLSPLSGPVVTGDDDDLFSMDG